MDWSAAFLRHLRGARDKIAEQFCAEATKQSRLSPRIHSGLLRCARNDGVEAHWGAFNSHFNCRHTSTFPRHVLPELCSSHPLQNREGAGKTGRRLAPMGPVRQACAKCTGRTRDSRDIPAFPAQWVDGLWRALPGDEFVVASVASRIGDTSIPVGSMHLRESLTVATTARTTRFCRTRRRRSSCTVLDRSQSLKEPPRDCLPRRRRPRPPHPDPRFVTTANRPFHRVGTNHVYGISEFDKSELFSWQRLDRGDSPSRTADPRDANTPSSINARGHGWYPDISGAAMNRERCSMDSRFEAGISIGLHR